MFHKGVWRVLLNKRVPATCQFFIDDADHDPAFTGTLGFVLDAVPFNGLADHLFGDGVLDEEPYVPAFALVQLGRVIIEVNFGR